MRRWAYAAAITVLTLTLLGAATTNSEIYRNEEFGITLPIPKGALRCPIPEDEHDHGPVFLLETADTKGCRDAQHSRYIDVFAGYNATDETKTLQGFLKWECANFAKQLCRPAPRGLHVTGLPSAAAQVNRSDGWIDIIVLTQAGKPDPDFDPSAPLINYNLTLQTRARYLDRDLRTFRAILRTIRLSPRESAQPEKSVPE